MKSLFLSLLLMSFTSFVFAQTATETLKVSGECGSCKKKIETAAKKAGASFASWDVDSKTLTVKYNSTSTNTAKIEKAIADAGYDTPDFRATDEAYNSLDGCCQYDRASVRKQATCDSKACAGKECMKDGKCQPGMACCKESECATRDCCKKS